MVVNATDTRIVSRSRQQAAIAKAQAKAHEQARIDNVPTLLRSRFDGEAITELWSIGSRTTGGTVYLVDARHDASGLTTMCECEAHHAGRVCWHRAAARLAHEDRITFHRAPGVARFKPRPAERRPPSTVSPAYPEGTRWGRARQPRPATRPTAAELAMQPATR